MLGVVNIKKGFEVIGQFTKVAASVAADGKVSFSDVGVLFGAFPILTELINLEYGEVLKELADLDEAEKKEVVAYFVQTFDLPENLDGIEKKAEIILEAGLEVYLSAKKVMKLVKELLA